MKFKSGTLRVQPLLTTFTGAALATVIPAPVALSAVMPKAPALTAKISPTFNNMKGYVISGFRAGSYGAEFMIFNATDRALILDSDSGNYLKIQGVTFTQQSDNRLSVDDYFDKNSTTSNPQFVADKLISNPYKWLIEKIAKPRRSVGVKIFAIPTIQLGDIVTLDYEEKGTNMVSSPLSRFVVYNIDYTKNVEGPEMTVFLSEVV